MNEACRTDNDERRKSPKYANINLLVEIVCGKYTLNLKIFGNPEIFCANKRHCLPCAFRSGDRAREFQSHTCRRLKKFITSILVVFTKYFI